MLIYFNFKGTRKNTVKEKISWTNSFEMPHNSIQEDANVSIANLHSFSDMKFWSSFSVNVYGLLVVFISVTGLRLDINPRATGCSTGWAPVCGNNSVTYGNRCMMEAK